MNKDPFYDLNSKNREKLKQMKLIVEEEMEQEPDAFDEPQENEEPDEIEVAMMQADNEFPDADYALQTEIVKFFLNNPGAEPELFRQFATSVGIDSEELQLQANILLSQLLNIYSRDANELGYGDFWNNDNEDELGNSLEKEIEEFLPPQGEE